jgi:hypothetical protein
VNKGVPVGPSASSRQIGRVSMDSRVWRPAPACVHALDGQKRGGKIVIKKVLTPRLQETRQPNEKFRINAERSLVYGALVLLREMYLSWGFFVFRWWQGSPANCI